MSSKQLKVVLLGLSLGSYGQQAPCLALYNLKLYAKSDPLLEKKISFHILDLPLDGSNDKKIASHILGVAPDLIAISCYLWSSEKLLKIAKAICKKIPSTMIIMGGPDAGPQAENILANNPFVSAVINGEGEESFRLLLRRLTGIDTGVWQDTAGVLCRSGDKIVSNPRPAPVDLDNIPLTIYDSDFTNTHGRWLYAESSRGCRYRCAYCSFYSQGYGWRMRSLDTLIKAIDYTAKLGGKFISFLDAGFNQDKARFRAVLGYTLKYPQLKFDGLEINIEDMEEEDILMLAKKMSGRLGIGLQTTNEKALAAIGRKWNHDRFRERICALRKSNLEFNIDLIYGLPNDNLEKFKKSIDDAYSMIPTKVIMLRLLVLPGTRLREQANAFKLKYFAKQPYKVISNSTFSKHEINIASRLAAANELLSTYSRDSYAFQLLSQGLNISPSTLLEKFISGSWRNKPLTEGEIRQLNLPRNIRKAIKIVWSFVNHEFAALENEDIPQTIKDAFSYQFACGIVNSHIYNKDSNPQQWPPKKGTNPRFSKNARLVQLQTNIFNFASRIQPIVDVPCKLYHIVVLRSPKTIKTMRVSQNVADILSKCNGRTSLEKILESLIDTKKNGTQTKFTKLFEDLTQRNIVIWV